MQREKFDSVQARVRFQRRQGLHAGEAHRTIRMLDGRVVSETLL